MRSKLSGLHKKLGLYLGIALLLQAVAGVAVVFKPELEAVPPASAQPLAISIEAARKNAETATGQQAVRIDFPTQETEIYLVRVADKMRGVQLVQIAAGDGRILRHEPLLNYPLEAILKFHQTWFTGDSAVWLLSFVGLTGFALALSGLYIWWARLQRRSKAFAIIGKPWTLPFWFSLHKTTGAFAFVLIAVMTFTGTLAALRGHIQPLIRQVPLPSLSTARHIETMQRPRLDDLVSRAARAVPDMAPTDIRLANNVTLVVMRGEKSFITGRVWFDSSSGEILRVQDAQNATWDVVFYDFILRLHDGTIAGLPGRLLVATSGIALIVLYASGFSLYFVRRSARRK